LEKNQFKKKTNKKTRDLGHKPKITP